NSLSPLQLEQYLAIADEVLKRSTAKFATPAPGADARAAARRVAQSMARKAYRRPASDEELDVLMEVFDLGGENDLDYQGSVRLMLKAMLVSPQFLFITPADEVAQDAEIVALDDHQLASRLSYLLWSTMPDEELMALAD